MKRNLVAIGLLAGGLVFGHSAASGAAEDQLQYRGEIAELALFQQTEITCEDGSSGDLHTAVSLELFADGVHGSLGNSDTRAMLLFFTESSSCTGVAREFSAFAEPAEYAQQRVKSASFAHSFDMVDVFTGEPIGNLTIDVELTGIGETSHINRNTSTTSGDFTFHSHVNGVFREAAASGTVSLDGNELIDSDQFASLSDLHSGSTTVSH